MRTDLLLQSSQRLGRIAALETQFGRARDTHG
jgi:hypothetical protein